MAVSHRGLEAENRMGLVATAPVNCNERFAPIKTNH